MPARFSKWVCLVVSLGFSYSTDTLRPIGAQTSPLQPSLLPSFRAREKIGVVLNIKNKRSPRAQLSVTGIMQGVCGLGTMLLSYAPTLMHR
ncbi:hypothetical protein BX600DRAFT_446856 [Xylariales sp. PMI_506]|nr:hypothetical protein BX600DRAFT_446856 [Xylariales sp. PMI_506]